MKSLKDRLKNLIMQKGEVSYGEMCQFTVEEGYKVSTAERRLRGLMSDKSESGELQIPEIYPIMKKSKRNTDYIASYKWGAPKQTEKRIVIENGRAIMYLNK